MTLSSQIKHKFIHSLCLRVVFAISVPEILNTCNEYQAYVIITNFCFCLFCAEQESDIYP